MHRDSRTSAKELLGYALMSIWAVSGCNLSPEDVAPATRPGQARQALGDYALYAENAAGYAPGSTVPVTWTAPLGHSSLDWVGLFVVGAPNNQWLTFQYAPSGSAGTLAFPT